ncbi:cytoplasmic protein [Oryzicola mucosus]|uniref:cytoplasmic protein n=1 Tax=Oryzicola mucosus TaxID=2767425 RepID=UPI001E5A9C6E|nr:cytoplasmic protein [Oryzicola mucosus]
MLDIQEETLAFRSRKERETMEARQIAALQLACGLDLDEALSSDGNARRTLLARLDRTLERERLKGLRRHWSYDLNRHIALKQIRDRLSPPTSDAKSVSKMPKQRHRRKMQTAPEGAVR